MVQEPTFDFSFQVSGKIWKIKADENRGVLIYELRDEANQEVFFLLFDWAKKEVSDYFSIPDVDWWTTLAEMEGGVIFLNKYRDKNDPSSRVLLVYTIDSKEIASFDGGYLNELTSLGYTVFSETTDPQQFRFILPSPKPIQCRYPVVFWEETEEWKTVKNFVGKEIAMGVEYFEESSMALFSYYLPQSRGFDRFMVGILNETEQFHIRIDEGVSGFAEGSFLIVDQSVIFVSHSNQFHVLHF